MITSIELQVISKLLTTESKEDKNILCNFDTSYYSVFKEHAEFIFNHRQKYGDVPDVFTFQSQFPDITLVRVDEPIEFLCREIKRNKQHIILLETFNKLKDLGSGDVEDAWQYLSNQCDRVAQLNEYTPMDIIKDAEFRSKQIVDFANQSRIPTGFDEIDKLMYGGLSTVEELLLIVARTNAGKAQPLWAPVLTPTGWKTMGELKIGDVVVGKNNDNGRVIQIFPQGEKNYYRIHFDDGTYAECCDDHLWEVLDSNRRIRSCKDYGIHEVLTTKEIRSNLNKRYSVDISEAIEFDIPFDKDAELDGYLLGLLIGDGSLRDGRALLTNDDSEIWKSVESIISRYGCVRSKKSPYSIIGKDFKHNFVLDKLKQYGLLNVKSTDKFIPKHYLTAPVDVRLALLAGLLDTDGYIPKNSNQLWEFDTASEQLAFDFVELARSLGVRVKLHDRIDSYYVQDGKRIPGSGSRHITCRSEFNPFRLSRKANRFVLRTTPYKRSMPKRHCKMIERIEYIGKTNCQCILLDNNTHTYITSGYTVTHNTWVCTRMMESAQRHGFPVLYYSPEMQASFLGTRFDTWRAHFPNNEIFRGKYDEQYNAYIQELKNEETSAFIVEDKDMPEGEVNVRNIQNLIKQHHIKLLIIDGLSYMSDVKKSDSDYVKYKNICLDLFKLSKQYGCAVVIAMQANRETRDSKDDKGDAMPTLYNVEGSDHPARIATQAFSIRQVFDKHVLDIRLEKSRNAANQKPILSYAWDVNTGNMRYLPDSENDSSDDSVVTPISTNIVTNYTPQSDADIIDDEFEDDDIEF